MFELFGKKPASDSNKSVPTENCRVVTDLLDANGDALDSWRVFRIMAEFVLGFELLRKHGLAATIFGGARMEVKEAFYKDAEELAKRLSRLGFTIITGGGPGIMEAANVGAFEAGGKSVGLNITLPMEQKLNPYVTESATFDFFFSRKVMLAYASEVYIFFPGGFGTLDEFFEIVTLVQTKKIEHIPVMLYGKEFWAPLIDWMTKKLCKQYKTIDTQDLELFHVVDSVDEAIAYVERKLEGKFPRQNKKKSRATV